jgi:hypothetical protein
VCLQDKVPILQAFSSRLSSPTAEICASAASNSISLLGLFSFSLFPLSCTPFSYCMPLSLNIESREYLLFHIPPVFEEWTIIDRYPTLGVSTGIYICIAAVKQKNKLYFLSLRKPGNSTRKNLDFISHQAHLSNSISPTPRS